MKNYNLLETVADISYLAGENKYFSGDSRADVSEFINWAIEFEKLHSKMDWGDHDYIRSVEKFTQTKILANNSMRQRAF